MNILDKLYDYNTPLDNDTRCEMGEKIEEIERALNAFISEYCERTGEEDWPVAADEQSCDLVKNAMKALDI